MTRIGLNHSRGLLKLLCMDCDADRGNRDTPQALTTFEELGFHALFDATPTPFLVVSVPDWIIVAVTEARLRITGMTREAQIGRRLFDVFPDDPADPGADGVEKLTASLERVGATKATDAMAGQRYTVREADGGFVERWWSPLNSPVLVPTARSPSSSTASRMSPT